MLKIKLIGIVFCVSMLMFSSLAIGLAFAQTDNDPSAFIIAQNAAYVGGSGWYAGYVVTGQSGTYTLNISVTGSQGDFPISNVKIIVTVNDAAQAGGLSSLSINGDPITTFTPGAPSYYGASGGPFSEPDFYGYNDQYTIKQLTYAQAHHPDNWYQIPVTVNFASGADGQNAKVMFLCYGTDYKGNDVKTPFSGGTLFVPGTLFVVPEYISPILALFAFFAAYIVFKKGTLFKGNK